MTLPGVHHCSKVKRWTTGGQRKQHFQGVLSIQLKHRNHKKPSKSKVKTWNDKSDGNQWINQNLSRVWELYTQRYLCKPWEKAKMIVILSVEVTNLTVINLSINTFKGSDYTQYHARPLSGHVETLWRVFLQSRWELEESTSLWEDHSNKRNIQSIVNYLCDVNSLMHNYIINLEEYNDYNECGFNCVPRSLLSTH